MSNKKSRPASYTSWQVLLNQFAISGTGRLLEDFKANKITPLPDFPGQIGGKFFEQQRVQQLYRGT
jgi:hypothetical protein